MDLMSERTTETDQRHRQRKMLLQKLGSKCFPSVLLVGNLAHHQRQLLLQCSHQQKKKISQNYHQPVQKVQKEVMLCLTQKNADNL